MTQSRRLPPARLWLLNESLRATANAYRNAAPQTALRGLAFRARRANITANELRIWITDHSNAPAVANLVSRPVFASAVADADVHHRLISTPAGRGSMRENAARLLVGHLMSPVPPWRGVSAKRVVLGRRALAILGQEFLSRAGNDGFDSILFSPRDLAVEMGLTKHGGEGALRTCKEAGWIRQPPSRPGTTNRWRLRSLTETEMAIAWSLNDLVAALASGDARSGWVETFYAAAHPAIGYGHRSQEDGTLASASIGDRPWIAGLAWDTAIPADVLGLTVRSVVRHRGAWLAALAAADVETSIHASLDAYAMTTGAADEYEESRAARLDAKKARTEDAARARRAKAEKWARIKAERDTERERVDGTNQPTGKFEQRPVWLTDVAARHPVPGVAADRNAQTSWARDVVTALTAVQMDRGDHRTVQRWLTRRLAEAGHSTEAAERVASAIVTEATTKKETTR